MAGVNEAGNQFCFRVMPTTIASFAKGSSFEVEIEYTVSKEVMLIVDLEQATAPPTCPPTHANCPHAQGTKALGGSFTGESGKTAIQVLYNHDGNPGQATVTAWLVDKQCYDNLGWRSNGWEITRKQEPVLVASTFGSVAGLVQTIDSNMCSLNVENEGAPVMLIIVLVVVCIVTVFLCIFLLNRYICKKSIFNDQDKQESGASVGMAGADAEKSRNVAAVDAKDDKLLDLEKQLAQERAKNRSLKDMMDSPKAGQRA